jgi:hypothetical protein
VENELETTTYSEVDASSDCEKWISTMQKEMKSLEKNGTWGVVCLPKQKKVGYCKWICKTKESLSPIEPMRFKERLVAKGFSQILGIDYNEVYLQL